MNSRFHPFVHLVAAAILATAVSPASADTEGDASLVAAAKARDRAAVQALLARRANPNAAHSAPSTRHAMTHPLGRPSLKDTPALRIRSMCRLAFTVAAWIVGGQDCRAQRTQTLSGGN